LPELYLDKLVAQLAYPLGLSLGLSLVSLLLLALRRRRWSAAAMALAVFWLGLWSLPAVSDALRLSLEARFANRPVSELPAAEVAVVLGGGIDSGPPSWPYPNLGEAADRAWHGARLYRAGRAESLILSGGRLGWQGEGAPESEAMRKFLNDLGVPDAVLQVEDRSRSTRENALYSAELIRAQGYAQVLLVTSALHMPRALASFRAVGIEATPAPCDFEVKPAPLHALRWMPDAGALAASTRALKEYLGWWMYRWRGWAVEAAQV
jgi:uncharacterized SAM-binding protein YcdF (DUF218 family)